MKDLNFDFQSKVLCIGNTFSACLSRIFILLFFLGAFATANAQAPSHDPSTMIRNNDGRYWIFTTGDGVWAMSSSNSNFSDWRPEPTPFAPGTWPGWINNYVDGFGGFFWAPDVIKIGNTYYLYYSCAGNGAPAAIGLATAPDLNGPWTDRGMVVAGNNAIDPALYMDNGRLWMSWGNWQTGLDICELSTSTGKRISGITHLVGGNVEGPGLIRNGNYYYLFYQRGLCCNGLNSSYYMVVARSTSITGPYTEERTFLPNRSGNQHGPGHFGYGEGKLTYHYYAVNDNGNAKLAVTTLGWSNGWPVAGGSGGWEAPSTNYRLRNVGTGLFLDGMGRTTNGDACGQYANTTHPNAQWQLIDVGNGYRQLRNVGTGLFLDGMGRTANGDDCGMWANTTHQNSHWSIQQYGSNVRIQNRATGLFLDGMGRSANGDNVGQYANTTHPNAQWQLVSATGARIVDVGDEVAEQIGAEIRLYPNPTDGYFTLEIPDFKGNETIRILDIMGKEMMKLDALEQTQEINISDLTPGQYILQLNSNEKSLVRKFIKQ
ncbi:family 43 glycosylhydrolase [Reichenbachiella ulvae]|uniref:Family 43 glycosylhydrolase n=1 Tax=Reichenbachiella ulvae TaxID=2980104 RepID=A0ABT3CZ27_9BACT|nr:family 43 glycosylhydrolase [Reichenbachiella ulvae]MCV9388774.1 family 43 glycosylhydrolase [Reichenbachiella ulvae]